MREITGKTTSCICGKTFEYDFDDTFISKGYRCLECPSCGEIVQLKKIDNISFPDDFNKFNGVNIEDSRINEWIKECIDGLKNDKNSDYHYISSGNTVVHAGYSDDNEIEITVAKNYWRTNIELE